MKGKETSEGFVILAMGNKRAVEVSADMFRPISITKKKLHRQSSSNFNNLINRVRRFYIMATNSIDQALSGLGLARDTLPKAVDSLRSDASYVLQEQLLFSNPKSKASIDLAKLGSELANRFSDKHYDSFLGLLADRVPRPMTIANIAENYGKTCGTGTLPGKDGYRQSIERFLELVLALILLTGGQPDQGVRTPLIKGDGLADEATARHCGP